MNSKSIALFIVCCFAYSTCIHADESAGKTIMARGEVNATNEVGERELKRRAPVFIEDSVKTGLVSATQLRMIDGPT